MQLVMRRERADEWFTRFKINARIVADEEERGLLDKYRLHGVRLTPGNRARDIRIAAFLALILALLAYFIAFVVFAPDPMARGGPRPRPVPSFLVALVVFVIATFFIYNQIREAVKVEDLLNGRDFRAWNFLGLFFRERRIRKMAFIFAYIVEQSKTWHKPEVIELDPQVIANLIERAMVREFEDRVYETV